MENELKIRELNTKEKEEQLLIKEKYLNEREKNISQREEYIKNKENEFLKVENDNKFNIKDLSITSGNFNIRCFKNPNNINNNNFILSNSCSYKNIPLPNSKRNLIGRELSDNPNREKSPDEAVKGLTNEGKKMITQFIQENKKVEKALLTNSSLIIWTCFITKT